MTKEIKKDEVTLSIKKSNTTIRVKLSDIEGCSIGSKIRGSTLNVYIEDVYLIYVATSDTAYIVTEDNYHDVVAQLDIKTAYYLDGGPTIVKYIKETSDHWLSLEYSEIVKPKSFSTTVDGLYEEIIKNGEYKTNSMTHLNKITKILDTNALTQLINQNEGELLDCTNKLLGYPEVITRPHVVDYINNRVRSYELIDLITKLKTINKGKI